MPTRLAAVVAVILTLGASVNAPPPARAAPFTFVVTFTSAQVVPPTTTTSVAGVGQLVFESDTKQMQFSLVLLAGNPSEIGSLELRQGAIGTNGVLLQQLAAGGWSQTSGRAALSESAAAALFAAQLYLEVRSTSGAPLARGQILPPGVSGALPTPVFALPTPVPPPPTTAPVAAPPGQARSGITPPSTGDAGLALSR